MAEISLHDVTKQFGNDVLAVNRVSLEIRDGEFMVLVGPSGCGKSTILRLVAGLEDVTAGEITIGGKDVTDLPSKQRGVAMVFQNYALFPHMTVADNIGFGLRLRKVPKAERIEKVRSTAATLGLEDLLERKPAQLSGGQLQRVAMGRAMVREPQAFLMDEPLSNLDAKLRVQMRAELASIHKRTGTTAIYVTHDQVEAMTLGDRVAVLRNGVLQQVDTPKRLYDQPTNVFVAAFMGSPAMNLVHATVDDGHVAFGGYSSPAPPQTPPGWQGDIILGIRPSAFSTSAAAGRMAMDVELTLVEELGSEVRLLFNVAAPGAVDNPALSLGATAEEAGVFEPSRLLGNQGTTPFTAILPPAHQAVAGQRVRLSVDPRDFHFFDPATGTRIDATHTRVTTPRSV